MLALSKTYLRLLIILDEVREITCPPCACVSALISCQYPTHVFILLFVWIILFRFEY